MDLETLDRVLLVGGLVLVAAILAVRLSVRVGVPSLLAYLLLGVLLGESSPIGIEFENFELTHALGFAALAVILAEGGLTTSWPAIRPHLPLAVSLATVGVLVSVVVVAGFAHLAFGLDWRLALLLGAVFAPTDAAAVFSTLRRVPLRPRLSGTLEAESGLNDAPTVVLVTLLSTGDATRPVAEVAGIMAYQLAAGVAVGLGLGWLGALVLRRVALPASGLYPIAVMTFAMLAYASAATLHASGFAAVYVAALVLGNTDLPHRPATRSFAEGLAWLAQIGLFVMLGLLASPSRLWGVVLTALAVAVVLMLLARPVSVVLSVLPFRIGWREQTFLSWAGLRGAVPVVLATIPLSEGVPRAAQLFDLVFVVVLVLTVAQAAPLPWLARRLGVGATEATRDVEVEAAPLERLAADLLEVRVPARSRLHGVEVAELRLPPGVSVALVVRGDRSFVPSALTPLRHGDSLLVVTPRRHRAATEARLQAVSRKGRLAGWRSGG